MDLVFKHRLNDFLVTVDTDIELAALNAFLAPYHQAFPLSYPPQTKLSQVLAEDWPAPETHWAGFPRDYVTGTVLQTAHGHVLRYGGEVVKNVTGYDLNKLFVGSGKCFGQLTRVTLKLLPLTSNAPLFEARFDRWSDLLAFVQACYTQHHPLRVCRLAPVLPSQLAAGLSGPYALWLSPMAGYPLSLPQGIQAHAVEDALLWQVWSSATQNASNRSLELAFLELAFPLGNIQAIGQALSEWLRQQLNGKLWTDYQLWADPLAGLWTLCLPAGQVEDPQAFGVMIQALQTAVLGPLRGDWLLRSSTGFMNDEGIKLFSTEPAAQQVLKRLTAVFADKLLDACGEPQ